MLITLKNVFLLILLFLPQLSYAVIIYGRIDGQTGATEGVTGFPANTPWTWNFSFDSSSGTVSQVFDNSTYIDRSYQFLTPTFGTVTSNGLIGPASITGLELVVDRSTNTLIELGFSGSGTSDVLLPNGDRKVSSAYTSITFFDVSTAGYQFIETDQLNIQMNINPGGCVFCGMEVIEEVFDSNGNLVSTQSVSGEIGSINRITLTTVPVPSAVWLFGSGLIGLIGAARRKKA